MRNRLNSPLFPTNGSRQEIEASFSGGMLGGDGAFQKYTASSSWWVPVGEVGGKTPGSRPIRFALGLTAKTGAIFGDASLFPFERFWMGGAVRRPLRGRETEITPATRRQERWRARLGPGRSTVRRRVPQVERRWCASRHLSLSFSTRGYLARREPDDPTRLFRGGRGPDDHAVGPRARLYGFDKFKPGWEFHFCWARILTKEKRQCAHSTAFFSPGLVAGVTSRRRRALRSGVHQLAEDPCRSSRCWEARQAFEAHQRFQAELRSSKELQQLIADYRKQAVLAARGSRSAIQQKEIELQQQAMQYERQAQERQQELVGPIMQRIETVINEIRQQGGYALIFDRASGAIIAADPALDLTDQVLARLRAMASN